MSALLSGRVPTAGRSPRSTSPPISLTFSRASVSRMENGSRLCPSDTRRSFLTISRAFAKSRAQQRPWAFAPVLRPACECSGRSKANRSRRHPRLSRSRTRWRISRIADAQRIARALDRIADRLLDEEPRLGADTTTAAAHGLAEGFVIVIGVLAQRDAPGNPAAGNRAS